MGNLLDTVGGLREKARSEAGNIVLLAECLPSVHIDPGSHPPGPHKIGNGVTQCNSNTWEVEAGGSETEAILNYTLSSTQGQPGLCETLF